MTEWPASSQFGKTAQKWRALAEKRRAYFTELYRSGRWKLYFTEDELLARIREVVAAAERWEQIAAPQSPPAEAQQPAHDIQRAA